MTHERESFVLWIERASARTGRLRGWVECLRRSERTRFDSTEALVHFLERCADTSERPVPAPPNDPGESR